MTTVYKLMLLTIALMVLVIPCVAYPVLSSSGISQIASGESFDSVIGPKNTWTSAEGNQWMMGWIRIVPGSELVNGTVRYKYKYDIAAAGSPQANLLYGPFSFNQGQARTSRQVDYLYLSGPGSYEVRFYVTDTQGGSDTLIASIPFTLQGGNPTPTPTQTPTPTATTVPVTTVPTTQVQLTYTTHATTPETATTTVTQTPLITTPVPAGSITIKSVPTGAMVYFDDVERGINPITIYGVPVGMHTVRLSTKGYFDNQTQVQILNNKETLLEIILLPKTSSSMTSTPTTIPITVQTTREIIQTPDTGTSSTITFDGGKVTARDALAALQMAIGKIPTDMKYDVTKDGSVNSADAQAILKIAASSL